MKTPECIRENRAISAAIKYGMEMEKINYAQLATAINESDVTLYRHCKHPGDFKLSELRLISAKLHMPLEKLVMGEI